MKTSRQRLLEYVHAHRSVTASDLARALRMTPANARHHLSVLEEQGLVQVIGQRPGKGKGRPARLYSLSSQALGHNLDRLSNALMDEVLSPPIGEGRIPLLKRVAARLAERVASEPGTLEAGKTPGASLTQRLVSAVQCLNLMNYQARWEAHTDAPRLILGHCPYAAILQEHPELCQLDAELLKNLLETPVRQVARLATDPHGLTCCVFLAGKRT